MRYNICLFTDSLEPSGVGEHILTLASGLLPNYRISFVCPPTPSGSSFLERAQRLGVNTLGLEARYNTPNLEQLYTWVCSQRFDLFHVHAGVSWEGFGGVEVAHHARIPAIVRTEHLPYLLTHPVQRADYERTSRKVDRIICVGVDAYYSYLEAGVPPSKLCVVRNGINKQDAKADRAGVRARLSLPEDARIALTVGRFSEQKGYGGLLDAIPAVLSAIPNVHFVWVGEGCLEGELRTRVKTAELGENVHFLSRRNDVAQLMAASDLFVLPSLFEGLPLSLLEAMSAGLPAVGTRVCGIRELISAGQTGLLVTPGDPDELAAAIIEAFVRPDLAAGWGTSARLLAAGEFRAERMVQEVGALYDNLLGTVRARTSAPQADWQTIATT